MSRKQKRETLQQSKQASPPIRQPLLDATAGFALNMQVSQSSSGPLPPPEALAKYNAVVPGLADKMVKMAEDEAAHRREMERNAQLIQGTDIRGYRRSELLGQIFGFGIGAIAICGAVYACVHGAQIGGGLIGTSGVTGLTAVFVLGRRYLAQQKQMELNHQLDLARFHDERHRATKDSVGKRTVSTVSTASPAAPDSTKQIS
jgi:uncharacterized membrane protein